MNQRRIYTPFVLYDHLKTPHGAKFFAMVCFLLLNTIISALVFIPWQQNVSGSGRVIAYSPLEREQPIEAPIEGRIVRWYVKEGSVVKKGERLVDISDNDPELVSRLEQERQAVLQRIDAARNRVFAFESRMTALQLSRLNAIHGGELRVAMAKTRTDAAHQGVVAAAAALRTAGINLDRQSQLEKKGLTATRQKELALLESQRSQADLQRAKLALLAARNEQSALQADRRRMDSDAQAAIQDVKASRSAALAEVANSQAELVRLNVRIARQNTQRVTAPRTGTILRLDNFQGSVMVKAGDPLATLVPSTQSRAVELWVTGNDIPLISLGRKVRLQFEGWPALQFGGWPSVAVGTFGGQVALIDSTDNGKGKFRIVVRPEPGETWPSHLFLRQGVRANGWILLNTVALGYEFWRQFNGFPPVIAENEIDAENLYYGKKSPSKAEDPKSKDVAPIKRKSK